MFTGIITSVGTIESVEARGDLRLRVGCSDDTSAIDLGASVACSGVCLTVVDKGDGWLAFDVSAETRSRTADDMWSAGRRLNLERALRLGDELGGHIVTGHVDGVGTVTAAEHDGDSLRLTIEADAAIAPYVAAKGSVALNGVSLTVNEVESRAGGGVSFGLNIIPHTAAQTTFDAIRTGDRVNIEIDILARYIGRILESRASAV
ncbi:MAG: riboflavin synthase [Allosphingosinicella sp.]